MTSYCKAVTHNQCNQKNYSLDMGPPLDFQSLKLPGYTFMLLNPSEISCSPAAAALLPAKQPTTNGALLSGLSNPYLFLKSTSLDANASIISGNGRLTLPTALPSL
uniref:Uncharacterized protein n=1 Tax=Daphnia magna TaxID=35525 RepID=A0A0P5CZ40_9CRUS